MQISPTRSHVATPPADQLLRAGDASLEQAREQLALVPRDEPSDVDGPLGQVLEHLLAAVALLDTDGVPAAGLSAAADARAAAELLNVWDGMGWGGGHAPSAGIVLDAADRLVLSAREALTPLLA
jgi:hypothetical protein